MKRIILFLAVGLTTIMQCSAQTDTLRMTLYDCLNYAKENSITLKQAQLNVLNTEADALYSYSSLYPSVSAVVGQNFNSNVLSSSIENQAMYSGNYGVDASMTLYAGGENRANMRQDKIEKNIASLSLAVQENSIEVAVTETFVEILYATDQIEVAKNSLELSTKNSQRGEILLSLGSINEAELAQLHSAQATDEYNVILAESNLSNLNVRLKQLLELSNETTIKAVYDDNSTVPHSTLVPSISEIYASALSIRPEIEAANLSISSAEEGKTIARSGYMPTLSASAGLGVNHSTNSSFSFSEQMQNQFSASVGVHLAIPIFTNNRTKTAVTKAKNSITAANLNLLDNQKQLYQTIEMLRNNVLTSQAMLTVAEKKLEANEKSLSLITQQYDLGAVDIIKLLTEMDNYRIASQEHIMNKYKLMLNRTLLNYYQTDIITL